MTGRPLTAATFSAASNGPEICANPRPTFPITAAKASRSSSDIRSVIIGVPS